MTNLFLPRLRAHKLSAAVGSGKTRAAVAWISSPGNATRNVLYVAPTKALIDQTAESLRRAIEAATGPCVRHLSKIHADTEGIGRGMVQAEALQAISSVEDHAGAVYLVTTQTFLALVSKIKRPDLWSVILDEAFAPATFTSFHLGADAVAGWEHFSELFRVDSEQGHRILAQEGRQAVIEEMARGVFTTAGDRFSSLGEVAEAVANPAVRCELVMTDGARALVEGQTLKKRGSRATQGTTLQLSSYVDPAAFSGFREVLFLSALFEETILYHLWTKALGVTFEEHPDFPSHLLVDTHAREGRYLAVGHLLHESDTASLENLQRDLVTGEPGCVTPGRRVIDHLVRTAAEHFGGEPFLLQTNARYGFTDGSPRTPRQAQVIPVLSHGQNCFQTFHNVAALAVVNPNPQQLAWVRDRTGMQSGEVTRAWRIHTVYQALGRCSIRKEVSDPVVKVALVAGARDARFIHDLFPGSHWLGQVGTLPALSGLADKATTKQPGKAEALAQCIHDYLKQLPATVLEIKGQTIRDHLERSKTVAGKVLIDTLWLGADERFSIDKSTWSRALALACIQGSGWQRRGHSVLRVTSALYGFEVET